MIEASFYGRAKYLSFGLNVSIHPSIARVWQLNPTAGGLTVTIPAAEARWIGGPVLIIFNVHAANSVTISSPDGPVVLVPQSSIIISVIPPGVWYGNPRATNAGVGPAVFTQGLIVAGGTGIAIHGTAEGYNQVTNVWAAVAAIPNNKVDAAAINYGPTGFFVGFTPITAGVSNKNDEIGATGTWTHRTDAPFNTAMAFAASWPLLGNGKLFSGTSNPLTAEFVLPAWTTKKAVPYTKTKGSAQGSGYKAFIISGEPVPIVNLAHDPVVDTYWSIAFQPGATRHSMSTFRLLDKIHAVGGRLDSPLTRYDLNEEYSPLTDTWATKTALAGGNRYAAAGIGGNDRGYITGGRDAADAAVLTHQSYNLDAWTTLLSMANARPEIQNSCAMVG